MTLKKATEILQVLYTDQAHNFDYDELMAMRLAAAALTYIIKNRYANHPHHIPLLQGETVA